MRGHEQRQTITNLSARKGLRFNVTLRWNYGSSCVGGLSAKYSFFIGSPVPIHDLTPFCLNGCFPWKWTYTYLHMWLLKLYAFSKSCFVTVCSWLPLHRLLVLTSHKPLPDRCEVQTCVGYKCSSARPNLQDIFDDHFFQDGHSGHLQWSRCLRNSAFRSIGNADHCTTARPTKDPARIQLRRVWLLVLGLALFRCKSFARSTVRRRSGSCNW